MEKLYKYLPMSKHSISIIVTNLIWYPSSNSFNDPFDSKFITADAYFKSVPEELEKIKKFEPMLQGLIDKMGILSLSETPSNILMWSHYADQHRGICIEFERTGGNNLETEAFPVIYTSIRDENYRDWPDDNVFARKYSGWRYEREWRHMNNKANQLSPIPGAISSIVMGARMSNHDVENIKGIIKNNNDGLIRLKQASMAPRTYRMKITDA